MPLLTSIRDIFREQYPSAAIGKEACLHTAPCYPVGKLLHFHVGFAVEALSTVLFLCFHLQLLSFSRHVLSSSFLCFFFLLKSELP